ncbi:hypothetical protein HPB50_008504 [Hyalomma asiaticum]|uniref:Uncharacterized protein n=1 Tax=Hyalomma asiaticum TaxID=266040 RepID=A0ACB7TF46_HYAAI|nr:hypothetical protein HPB50_008504 [Hyalomma asiaticum]
MISALTATRIFEETPCLLLWTLRTCAWILAVTVIVNMSWAVAEWLRLWWYLLDVPKPKPQKSSVILLDIYKQLSAMGPTVDIKVKAFRYLKGLFESFEDQDVTVAFYGPYAILLGATPQVAEVIVGFYTFLNLTGGVRYLSLFENVRLPQETWPKGKTDRGELRISPSVL